MLADGLWAVRFVFAASAEWEQSGEGVPYGTPKRGTAPVSDGNLLRVFP